MENPVIINCKKSLSSSSSSTYASIFYYDCECFDCQELKELNELELELAKIRNELLQVKKKLYNHKKSKKTNNHTIAV